MSSNSFSVGIEPGGLRSIAEIKILICYILNSMDCDVSQQLVVDSIITDGLANYFDVISSFDKLVEQNTILKRTDSDNNELFSLSKDGKLVVENLVKDLPYAVKKKALKTAMSLKSQLNIKNETLVEFKEISDGYMVECSLLDKDDKTNKIMTVALRVPDLMQSNTIKNRFLSNPSAFYRAINALFVGEPSITRQVLKELDNNE